MAKNLIFCCSRELHNNNNNSENTEENVTLYFNTFQIHYIAYTYAADNGMKKYHYIFM